MSEEILFEAGNYRVTNKRFVNGGKTIPIHTITTVRAFPIDPDILEHLKGVGIGVGLVMFAGFFEILACGVIGLIVLAVVIGLWVNNKTKYALSLDTLGDDVLITSENQELMVELTQAINEAIAKNR